MIEINNLTKRFDNILAVDNLSLTVPTGAVLGLVGSNGGGKSTLLRMLSGVYCSDSGSILVDGQPLYDNPIAKGRCFFISDFPYFYNNSTVNSMASLYRDLYPNWSEERFERMCAVFPIDPNMNIINMSKGMQRQSAIILAMSTCPGYLYMDEIFDGLDPVMRLMLKRIIVQEISEHQMTTVIASHNLRELQDLCDRICLMHRGRVVLDREVESLNREFRKVQVAFPGVPTDPNLFAGINVVSVWQNGNVFDLTIRGSEEEFMPRLNALKPLYVSPMPLSLEEIFITEMGVYGYDANFVL